MALGARVLVSSVAFEVMDEAYEVGGFDAASLGLLAGAVTFFLAARTVNRRGGGHRKNSGDRFLGTPEASQCARREFWECRFRKEKHAKG